MFLKDVSPLILYDVELGMAMETMQGIWVSSRFDLGYTELFCIPEVTSAFFSSCDRVLGLSGVPSSKTKLLTCLFGNMELLCMQSRGVGPHLSGRGKSHGFSRVVAGTSGIFSSYSGDGHSKLEFVRPSQDSCLLIMDTSGI